MVLERARAHFEAQGWTVEAGRLLGSGPLEVHPDLLLTKDGRAKAVKLDDEPTGAFPIGNFAARCKRLRIAPVIVCPNTPEVLEACDAAGAEFVDADTLGAAVIMRKAAPAVIIRAASPVPSSVSIAPVRRPVETPPIVASARIPWWRWAIVAVIWAAALYFVVQFWMKVTG